MIPKQCCWILDANVIIDFHECGLLEVLFNIPDVEIYSPDVILADLYSVASSELTLLGLKKCNLSGDNVLYVEKIASCSPSISPNDIFALVCAETNKAVLITRDEDLKKLADKLRVKHITTLDIFLILIKLGMITKKEALDAIAILENGERSFSRNDKNAFSLAIKKL